MFGLVPRVVWSRNAPPDERGRITVQHNCLLLERSDSPPPSRSGGGVTSPRSDGRGASGDGAASPLTAPKLMLIEVGTGNKLDEKSRDIFAMGTRSILDALHEKDCRPEDIEAIAVTHLHFDHAGGLTRLALPGEKPDWTGAAGAFGAPRGEHGVKLAFPNATVFTQARELADGLANRSVMTRTYFGDHLLPMVASGRLKAVDSPRPFITGETPERDSMPRLSIEQRSTEIAPGVFVFLVPGHTWGQQAIMFTDTAGKTVVFTPDVMPTAWHNGAAYSLGYDVEPYTSMISRQWFLAEAADRGWTLVLDHEAGNPVRTVVRNGKGWFDLREG